MMMVRICFYLTGTPALKFSSLMQETQVIIRLLF